jgi:AcrR family transcriptional regulator
MLILKMSTLSNAAPPVEESSKRERNKRDKEARIRRAALTLIRDKGFAATTTREVAERAGIAAGTLFLYVKTKEELLDFVFTGEIAAVVDEAFASLPAEGDVVARMMHVFGRLLDFYAADVALARLLVVDAMLPRPGARSVPLTFAFVERMARILGEAQARGQLAPDGLPDELAMHAFLLYVGGVLHVINGFGTAEDARRTVARALEVHLSGLRPKEPRPSSTSQPRRRKP